MHFLLMEVLQNATLQIAKHNITKYFWVAYGTRKNPEILAYDSACIIFMR